MTAPDQPLQRVSPSRCGAAAGTPTNPGGSDTPLSDDTCTCNQCIVTDLARVKAVFQLRAITAAIGMPHEPIATAHNPDAPIKRVRD